VRVIIFKLFLSLAVAFNCHSFKVHCINRASLTEPVLYCINRASLTEPVLNRL